MDQIDEDGVRNRLEKRMEHEEQLLPGILDEITFKEIVTKLPWREFNVLARVNRRWHNAIYYRQVYDARVRSSLTETFVVVKTIDDEFGERGSRLVLCCLRDNSCRKLSPFPPYRKGYHASDWIVVDGTVYASVGSMVFALDLAGQRPWRRCAKMQKPRYFFALASMDEKIYVFGGMIEGQLCSEAEVFDPKENRWSLITPMPVPTFLHGVVALGDELVVYGPYCRRDTARGYEACLEIYHPLKDEWRTVSDPFQSPFQNSIFVAHGKLHSLNHSGIYVQNSDGNSCTELHSNSLAAMEDANSLLFVPLSTLVVDDEIFAMGYLNDRQCLLRSREFGIENEEMAWQEETNWPSKGCSRCMHAIEL